MYRWMCLCHCFGRTVMKCYVSKLLPYPITRVPKYDVFLPACKCSWKSGLIFMHCSSRMHCCSYIYSLYISFVPWIINQSNSSHIFPSYFLEISLLYRQSHRGRVLVFIPERDNKGINRFGGLSDQANNLGCDHTGKYIVVWTACGVVQCNLFRSDHMAHRERCSSPTPFCA